MSTLLAVNPPDNFWIWVGVVCGIVAVGFEVAAIIYSFVNSRYAPRWRLKHRITKWLLSRNWEIWSEELSPSLEWGLWVSDPDNTERRMLICQEKRDKDIISLTADVPFAEEWIGPLAQMPERQGNILAQDLGIFINTKDLGFVGIQWPLKKLVVQNAIPIDNRLSEYTVDLEAKKISHAVTGARRIIRKAVIEFSA